jgi:hypothetical protein
VDVSRVARIGFELSSELFYDNAQVLDLASCVPLPYGLRQALMCQWLLGMRDQVLQYREFLGSEVDNTAAGTFDLVGPQVNRPILKDNLASFMGLCHPPNYSSHAGQQFWQYEGDRNEIIGPGV